MNYTQSTVTLLALSSLVVAGFDDGKSRIAPASPVGAMLTVSSSITASLSGMVVNTVLPQVYDTNALRPKVQETMI